MRLIWRRRGFGWGLSFEIKRKDVYLRFHRVKLGFGRSDSKQKNFFIVLSGSFKTTTTKKKNRHCVFDKWHTDWCKMFKLNFKNKLFRDRIIKIVELCRLSFCWGHDKSLQVCLALWELSRQLVHGSHSLTRLSGLGCSNRRTDCRPPGSSIQGYSLSKNTLVGCHFLLQGIFPT